MHMGPLRTNRIDCDERADEAIGREAVDPADDSVAIQPFGGGELRHTQTKVSSE